METLRQLAEVTHNPQSIADALAVILIQQKTQLTQLIEDVSTVFEQFSNDITGKTTQVGTDFDTFEDNLETLQTTAQTDKTNLLNTFSSQLQEAVDGYDSQISAIISNSQTSLNSIMEQAQNTLEGLYATGDFVISTYTPTLVSSLNITNALICPCGYFRIGAQVHVFGAARFQVTSPSNGSATLLLSLPVSSNMNADHQLCGTGAHEYRSHNHAVIYASTSPIAAKLVLFTTEWGSGQENVFFHFHYHIV